MFFRIVFVTLAISTIPLHLLAQAPGGQNLPPGFVDGSKNPTLIPDHASYRLVMIHLASLGSADSTRAAARQRAVYSRIGLSPADTITLQTHITAFKAAYSQWQTQAGLFPSPAAEQDARRIVLASRDAIFKGLTPEGVLKFAQFVEQEKAHMIVRP